MAAPKSRKAASIPSGSGEFQCILRLQEEDADQLHQILDANGEADIDDSSPEASFLAVKFEDNLRRGQVRIGDKLRGFTVKDLPTIVECYKTKNNVDIVKVADVSQIIECGSNPEPPPIDTDAINQPGDLESTRETRLLKHKSKDGLTAPMKNAVKTRFRKSKGVTKSIDFAYVKREVTSILRRDAEAEIVKVEYLDSNDNRIDSDEFPLIEPIDRTREVETFNIVHLVQPGHICVLCNALVPEGRYHTTKNCTTVLPEQVIRPSRTWHKKSCFDIAQKTPKGQPRMEMITVVGEGQLQKIKESLAPGYKRPTQKQLVSIKTAPVQVEMENPAVEKSPSPLPVPSEVEFMNVDVKEHEEEVQMPFNEIFEPPIPAKSNNGTESNKPAVIEPPIENPKAQKPKPAVKKPTEKKKKDPAEPKKPVNAYLHWCKVHRVDFVKPGMRGIDVTRAAARAWKNLEDKAVWQEMADADKKRYEQEMAVYNAR